MSETSLRPLLADKSPEDWDFPDVPAYRAEQIRQWVYDKGVLDFDAMTNLPSELRTRLTKEWEIRPMEQARVQGSADVTRKFLWRLRDGLFIESVLIPATLGTDGSRASRLTLCVSTQVGCALGCKFCASGLDGLKRNLSTGEILGQILLARNEVGRRIDNLVFMGMGEPLTNMHSVVKATSIMMSDLMYGISRRKITISTSGVVPNIYKLSQLTNASLAISLHSADNKIRDQLVPINKSYNIQLLTDACWAYADATNARYITFEYVMLDGVNDSIEDAESLAKLLKHKPAKVNLIPFNSFKDSPYQCSDRPTIELFCKLLQSRGIFTTIRKTRGSDIDAACGQLAGKVNDKIKHPLSKRLQ